MFGHLFCRRNAVRFLAPLAGILLLVAVMLGLGDTALQAETAESTLAPAAWTSCTPIQAATFSNRVHVRCAEAVSGISFFAATTTDQAFAARVLSLVSTAQVAGKTLAIQYNPADTSGAAVGCLASDCRLIIGVGFGQ